MAESKPPDPWRAVRCSKPQVGGDWFVVRDLLVDESNSHFEQLRDENFAIRRFETEASALAAIEQLKGASNEH